MEEGQKWRRGENRERGRIENGENGGGRGRRRERMEEGEDGEGRGSMRREWMEEEDDGEEGGGWRREEEGGGERSRERELPLAVPYNLYLQVSDCKHHYTATCYTLDPPSTHLE